MLPTHTICQRTSFQLFSNEATFQILRPIPKKVFQENYPPETKTLGDLIRKMRMDKGLTAKEVAIKIGANENSVLNWELRNVKPSRTYLKRIYEFFEIESLVTNTDLVKKGILKWSERVLDIAQQPRAR